MYNIMQRRSGPPQWLNHHLANSHSFKDHDLSSNAAQDTPHATFRISAKPRNSSEVGDDDDDCPTELYRSKTPTRGINPVDTPCNVRTTVKRPLRVSHRLYDNYDQRWAPPPSLTASSAVPPSKDPYLPLFPRLLASATKVRSHEVFRYWRRLLRPLYESPSFWLVLYFFFNLSLTLYNKFILIEFPFPYTLTALHALCSAAGSSWLLWPKQTSLSGPRRAYSRLNWQEIMALTAFSILFTVNIAISNISLHYVTVPFHQVVRSTTPLFTILLSRILFGSHSSREKITSLLPVVAGVAFATYGDYHSTLLGFFLTLFGTVLAAVKTIMTNVLQTSPQSSMHSHAPFSFISHFLQPRPILSTLSPVEHLHLLSPLAFVQALILAHLTGELKAMCHYMLYHLHHKQLAFLIINGLLAFGLNVASFGANKRVGAITMSVAGNVKQVLTMLCAVVIFDLRISLTNAIGFALTLGGGAWYTAVETREKHQKLFREPTTPSYASPAVDRIEMGHGPG